jgi:hypothetical protein
MIQRRVIAEWRSELERSQQPGYVTRYDDAYEDDVDAADRLPETERKPAPPPLPKGTHIEPAESEVPPPHIGHEPRTATNPKTPEGPELRSHPNEPTHTPPGPARDGELQLKLGKGEFGAGNF